MWNLRPTPGLLNHNLHFLKQQSEVIHMHVKIGEAVGQRNGMSLKKICSHLGPVRFLDMVPDFSLLHFIFHEFSRWSISGRPTLSLDKTSMIEMKELLENSSLTSLTNVLKKQKFQSKLLEILEFYNQTWKKQKNMSSSEYFNESL